MQALGPGGVSSAEGRQSWTGWRLHPGLHGRTGQGGRTKEQPRPGYWETGGQERPNGKWIRLSPVPAAPLQLRAHPSFSF